MRHLKLILIHNKMFELRQLSKNEINERNKQNMRSQ